MAYTVLSPSNPWLFKVTEPDLFCAIQRKAAWDINQGAHAIIIDQDGYIVSTREQNIEIVKQERK